MMGAKRPRVSNTEAALEAQILLVRIFGTNLTSSSTCCFSVPLSVGWKNSVLSSSLPRRLVPKWSLGILTKIESVSGTRPSSPTEMLTLFDDEVSLMIFPGRLSSSWNARSCCAHSESSACCSGGLTPQFHGGSLLHECTWRCC